jgi:hypothetical protein
VRCKSVRANREQFFNQEGVVVNRIGRHRDVVYVRLDQSRLCPPFFEDELELLEDLIADINTEEVA